MNHYLHAKADDAAEAIENYISMHNLNPHDRIPSERAMAEELGINRTTCREALKRLENEHILYSIVGSGTYVAPPKTKNQVLVWDFHWMPIVKQTASSVPIN